MEAYFRNFNFLIRIRYRIIAMMSRDAVVCPNDLKFET